MPTDSERDPAHVWDRRAPAPIGHVGLTVPDVEAAVRWYSDVLGWALLMGPVDVTTENRRVADQLRDVFDAGTVVFRQAHMRAGDGTGVELFEFFEPHRTVGRAAFDYWRPGPFHLCVVDAAIDDLAARIERTGGKECSAVRAIFPGEPFRFCYCQDPFGNVLEIATHSHAEVFGGREAY